MDPTSKFQEALHVALLPVAPGLSATHATRCRRAETQASLQNACSKCGTYFFEGMTRIRISRGPSQASEGKASSPKTLTRICGLCGWTDTLAIPPQSKASTFPRMRKGRRVGAATAPQATRTAAMPAVLAVPAVESSPAPKSHEATSSSPAPTTQQARPRPKKKKYSALQEMLARNKQNSQSQSKESNGVAHGKLAAFLSDL